MGGGSVAAQVACQELNGQAIGNAGPRGPHHFEHAPVRQVSFLTFILSSPLGPPS